MLNSISFTTDPACAEPADSRGTASFGKHLGIAEEADSRFKRLADSGIIGIFEGNGSGQIVDGNQAFLQMLGYTREDLEADAIRWDWMSAPEFAHVNRALGAQLAAHGTTTAVEIEYLRKNGSRVPALVGLASLPSQSGGTRAIGFTLDLTEQKLAQQALRESEEQFRQMAENIQEVFWMTDRTTSRILYVSPVYEKIWGRTCESLYDNPESWLFSIHSEDRPEAQKVFQRQLSGEILGNEYRIVQPSGAIRWIRDRAFPVRDREGKVIRIAGVAEDTTDRKLAELRLIRQASYDDVTLLPNRCLFRERLTQAIANREEGKTGAVFFIDLDRFKLVNDTLGHQAGDYFLREVADRLLAACGGHGTLARFGSDEFAFVAIGFEGLDAIRNLAQHLLRSLEAPFRKGDRELFIGACIGVSLFPQDGNDPGTLKQRANVAMHEAKRSGRNVVGFFTPALAETARERLDMETRLRKAVALNEMKLQFQPQFAFGSSRPSRFEALVRWQPFGKELVPPLKFIPVAEMNGLILPIGTWVLREACRRCREWQAGTLHGVGVAVNVSALQFVTPDFVEVVAQSLKAAGLPAHLLELELTESVLVQDAAASARILTKLRSLGVTIALDDFGTGYSSLSYLQTLPIDALKIDRSFLNHAESGDQGAAVMRCVVDLAHALRLRVVAEGVETEAQLDLLGRLGCDETQGFLLGKPVCDISLWEALPAPQSKPSTRPGIPARP